MCNPDKRAMRLDFPIHQSKKERLFSLFMAVFLAVVAGVMSHTYRPYIYSHQLDDCHFADSLTNFFGVPAAVCLCVALCRELEYNAVGYVFAVCLAFVIYEFFGFTFDYWDIIATFLSGGLTMIPLHIYMRRHQQDFLEDVEKCRMKKDTNKK